MNMKLATFLLLALLLACTTAEEASGAISFLDPHSVLAIKVRKALLDEINRARKDCQKEMLHELNVVNIQEEVVSGILYIVRFRIGNIDATAQLIDRPNAFHSLSSDEQAWEATYFLRAMFTSGNKAIHPCDFVPHQHEVSNTPDKEAVRTLNSDQSQTWHATVYGRKFAYGALPPQNVTVEGHETLYQYVEESVAAVPKYYDLRLDPASRGCVALNVEDQGSCGSCYAFAGSHTLALRHCKQTKGVQNYEFSEQWIMCESGRGCDGGWFSSASSLADKKGLVLEYTYPYVPKKECPGLKVTTWYFTTLSHTCLPQLWYGATKDQLAQREKQMQQEIMNGGVYVAFEITEKFSSYRGGIFTCGATDRFLNAYHAVIAVGWGQEVVNGQVVKYWIMKNSWGPGWGEYGFFRIRRGANDCDIESLSVCYGNLRPHTLTCANGNVKKCQHGGQLVRSSCTCKCNDRSEGENCEKCKPCANNGVPIPENNCQCKCPQGLFNSCDKGAMLSGTCLDTGALRITFQALGFGPYDRAYLAYGDAPFWPEGPEASPKILYMYAPGRASATITVPWSKLQNRSIVLFSVHDLGVNEFGYPRGWSVSPTGRVLHFSNNCQNVPSVAFE